MAAKISFNIEELNREKKCNPFLILFGMLYQLDCQKDSYEDISFNSDGTQSIKKFIMDEGYEEYDKLPGGINEEGTLLLDELERIKKLKSYDLLSASDKEIYIQFIELVNKKSINIDDLSFDDFLFIANNIKLIINILFENRLSIIEYENSEENNINELLSNSEISIFKIDPKNINSKLIIGINLNKKEVELFE